MKPRFLTPAARLTRYSFGCGYNEVKSTDLERLRETDLYTELYHEGAVYHVRQFDRRPGAETFRVFWVCFDKLRDARKLFDEQPGTLKDNSYYET